MGRIFIALTLVLAAPLSLHAQNPQDLPSAPQPAPPPVSTRHPLPPPTRPLAIVNGLPYVRPTAKDQFHDYLRDSYGLPAMARSFVRSLYSQSLDHPSGWGQDWPGFGQRFGSNVAVTAINGNFRYGLENLFHEDMRYYVCHHCSVGRKIGNAFLAEVTARHDADGHRFFTITPLLSDFPGPILANTFWYPPNHGPIDGVISVRIVAGTRVGAHLFREFVMDRDKKPKPPRQDPQTPTTP